MIVINDILKLEDFKHKKNLDEINLLWRAIMTMDIIEIYVLLPENLNYFGLTKTEFVKQLDNKFKKHRFLEDEAFYLTINKCFKCHKDEMICEFVGLESAIGLSLYFEIKNSKLAGLQFCDAYGKIEDLDAHYDWGLPS
ncbi:hypothetical protein ITJ86_05140 [Winogradskyella sp. F6397]|uniref:Uncharacterized protein n=1 Tax=Winogradskyella marina TaxID=2785530 RepID=A0ABS0EFN8_9FLAO|nr:hypothetical protein [Winogradskyella marina]MBF8149269.1 hypothetical protein [Winogradskyella marina]